MGADLQEENPWGFEGFEKRLEVEFEGGRGGCAQLNSNGGLRSLSRYHLDEMLKAAECTIVSEQHNQYFDAYVLSESSLFVYPRRLILKTCGRTRLLDAVPVILRHASSLSLQARRCKYSRGTFIFPDAQPFPYTSFNEEVRILDELFAPMLVGGSRSAHMLDGDPDSGSSGWHIYTAMAASKDAPTFQNVHLSTVGASLSSSHTHPSKSLVAGQEEYTPITKVGRGAVDHCMKASSTLGESFPNTYTVEMCMTHLHPSSALHFMNPSGTKSGADMTSLSGISSLIPNALISDFAFSPCGYSMNGLENDALSTIHITPEEGHSYASFEIMGYDPSSLNLQALVNCVVACFKPGSMVMSIHTSAGNGHGEPKSKCNSWCTSQVVPQGYVCKNSVRQELAGNGIVVFHTFRRKRSSVEEEFGMMPKALCFHANITNAPMAVDEGLVSDQVVVRCMHEKGGSKAMYELEDRASVEMDDTCHTPNTHFTYSPCDQVFPLSLLPTKRVPYEGLKTIQSMSSCDGSAMFTVVDSELELFQLQKCHPTAKVILQLQPESEGDCHVGLSPNVEELIRKSKRLGLEVVGIAVDVGVEPWGPPGVGTYKKGAIIRAASRVCMNAKALGLPHLKLLAMGQCA